MIEIVRNLFVGDAKDAKTVLKDWAVLTAARDPWHKQAVGYEGPTCPKDHPEYLWAKRGDNLILNMVDADDAKYFNDSMVDAGLLFVAGNVSKGKKTIIHCNEGRSRAPCMALMYLRKFTIDAQQATFGAAEAAFKTWYPPYRPNAGIHRYMRNRWNGMGEGIWVGDHAKEV